MNMNFLNIIKGFFSVKFLKFIVVGVINTLVGSVIMFGLYNFAGCPYWISSAANYILVSFLSFFLNKRFTFRNSSSNKTTLWKFMVNIVICYLISYGIAKPLVSLLISNLSIKAHDNISMLAGMCIFTILNYSGQRLFVFKNKNSES